VNRQKPKFFPQVLGETIGGAIDVYSKRIKPTKELLIKCMNEWTMRLLQEGKYKEATEKFEKIGKFRYAGETYEKEGNYKLAKKY